MRKRARPGLLHGSTTILVSACLLASAVTTALATASSGAPAPPVAHTAAAQQLEELDVPAPPVRHETDRGQAFGKVAYQAGTTYTIQATGRMLYIANEGTTGERRRLDDPLYCVQETWASDPNVKCQANEPGGENFKLALNPQPGRRDITFSTDLSSTTRPFVSFAGLAVVGNGSPGFRETPYNASNSYTGTFTPKTTGYLYAWVNSPDNPSNRLSRISGLFEIKVFGAPKPPKPPPLPAAPRGKGPNVNAAFSMAGPVRDIGRSGVTQASLKGLCGLGKRGALPRRGTSFSTTRSFGSFTYADTAVTANNDGRVRIGWRCTGGGRYRATAGGARETLTFDLVSTSSSNGSICERDSEGTLVVTSLRNGTDLIRLDGENCEREMSWTSKTSAFGLRVQAQRR